MTEDLALPFDRPGPLASPPAYAELHATAPVARVKVPGGQRAWVVTSYDAVVAVLTDRRFGMAPPGVDSSGNVTLFQDGEAHARLRRLVAKAFTPRAIAKLRPHIEDLAAEQATTFAATQPPTPPTAPGPLGSGGQAADLVAGFAAPFSARVIADLLGVRIGDRERFHGLAETLATADLLGGDPEGAEVAAQAWLDLTGDVARTVAAKRDDLGDDLISALIGVHDSADGRLTENELIGMATTLVTAGYQTARNAIAAATLQLLTTGRLAEAAAGGERLDALVEEVLRCLAGLIAEPFPRWAQEDLDLAGTSIAAGDLVLPRLEAANHDPRHFPDPDRFLPDRFLPDRFPPTHVQPDRLPPDRAVSGRMSATAHVSFGRGPHHCLGAALARIELTAALQAIAQRLPGLRLAVPVEAITWNRGLSDAGPESVPVTW